MPSESSTLGWTLVRDATSGDTGVCASLHGKRSEGRALDGCGIALALRAKRKRARLKTQDFQPFGRRLSTAVGLDAGPSRA
jgi:hypothetical protein